MIEKMIYRGLLDDSFPRKLYKFRTFGKRTNEIITTDSLYFSSPLDFNDPFDCNLSYIQNYTKIEILDEYKRYVKERPDLGLNLDDFIREIGFENKKFVEFYEKSKNELVKDTGILSLSKEYSDITMWSHYSNNHKGLVFELNVIEDISFFKTPGFVEYRDQYEPLSYIEDNKKELPKLFLTKHKGWKYENEVRIIDYDKKGLRKFKKEILSSIIFGFKSNDNDISDFIKLCEKSGYKSIIYKKARLVDGKFELDFDVINKKNYV